MMRVALFPKTPREVASTRWKTQRPRAELSSEVRDRVRGQVGSELLLRVEQQIRRAFEDSDEEVEGDVEVGVQGRADVEELDKVVEELAGCELCSLSIVGEESCTAVERSRFTTKSSITEAASQRSRFTKSSSVMSRTSTSSATVEET